jgi:hypothetical protein
MPATPERRAQMRLARARPADEHRVVRGLGERQVGQLVDQRAVDLGGLEVEAGQVAVRREARGAHLVAHRAHRPVGALGLQQVLDQPARAVHADAAALGHEVGPGAGHAVQPQRLEFGGHVTHGPPPGRLVAQAVVAARVGTRCLVQTQRRLHLIRRRARVQPPEDVEHVLGADGAGLQHQLGGYEHGVQAGSGHRREHLRHHAVASRAAQQRLLQGQQRRGHVGERRAVAQHAGLALHQRDVVLPVVAGLAAVAQARVAGDDLVLCHDDHPRGVQPGRDHVPGQLARHRVAVAQHRHRSRCWTRVPGSRHSHRRAWA